MFKPLCVIALLALAGTSRSSAQSSIVHVDIGPCLAIQTEMERKACYVARVEQARAAPTVVGDPSAPSGLNANHERQQQPGDISEAHVANHALQAADEFGRKTPSAAAQEIANARILANENGGQELVGTIASLDERMPNMWDVTLSNEQVWRQVNSDVYRLQKGMEVRIYPSPFAGSFRMSAKGKNGFIQVRRIK